MKKAIYILASLLLIITACKKNDENEPDPQPPVPVGDTTKPVLNLYGNKNDTIILQTNYSEPGATAVDNKDGDISPFIVLSGTVNSNLRGDYIKEYNVRDAAGNMAIKAIRKINVKNGIQDLEGVYTMTCKCYSLAAGSSTLLSTSNHTANVVASHSLNNVFDNSNVYNGKVTKPFNLRVEGANIIGNLFTASQIGGAISPSKTSFTVTIETYDAHSPNSVACSNVYTKQ